MEKVGYRLFRRITHKEVHVLLIHLSKPSDTNHASNYHSTDDRRDQISDVCTWIYLINSLPAFNWENRT